MTGQIELDDATRWVDAESILDGTPTASAERRLRQFRRRMWLLVGGVVLVCVVVGVAVGLAIATGSDGGHDDGGGDGGPLWASVLGLVVDVAGLVLIVVGVLRMRRSGAWRGAWRAPALVLSRGQRRELLQQVRGRRPADPARLGLARDVADRIARVRGFPWLLAGLVVQQGGQAVGNPSLLRWVSLAAFCVGYAVLLVVLRRQRAQAAAFLDRNPVRAAG